MKVDLNLRDEMTEWIRDYGVHILYQKSSRMIRCTCFSSLYQSGDPSCKKCNGTGNLIKTEKIKVLTSEIYPPNRRNKVAEQTQVGDYYNNSMHFYFTYNKPPQLKDIIYVVGWNGNRPVNVLNVYEIISYQTHRGENGRVEFYVANTQLKPELVRKGQDYINRMGSIR